MKYNMNISEHNYFQRNKYKITHMFLVLGLLWTVSFRFNCLLAHEKCV